ncbi:MAG: TlyA family RNA methyltransferase, partial [Vallitaleaceae bacterium]|nr:TlyA family RNA methyltransferase [Vallitaleaceae bacterium]
MDKKIKERIDVLIYEKGLVESREKAKTRIMMGHVFVNGQREDKPGTKVDIQATIEIKGNPNPYVSRGGLKLEKAIHKYNLDLSDKICMDIGASTGGFTDCMLQNGAKKVYAVDVGYGQLAWKLRQNKDVVVMEKTNIRYVTKEQVEVTLDFFSIDVSFISLRLVIPAIMPLLITQARGVCLIKPQ